MKRPTLSNDSAPSYPGRTYVSPSTKTSAQTYQKSLGMSFNSPKSETQKGFAFPQKATGTNLRSSMKLEKTEPTLERKNSKGISESYVKPSTPTQTSSGVSRSNKLRGSSTKLSTSDKSRTDQLESSKPYGGSKYSETLNLRDSLLKQARQRGLEVSTDIQTFKTSGAVKAYSTKNKDIQERLQASHLGASGTSFTSYDQSSKYPMNQTTVHNLNRYEYVRTEASDDKQTPTVKQKNALSRILANTSEKGNSSTVKKAFQPDEPSTSSTASSPNGLKINNFFSSNAAKKKDPESATLKKESATKKANNDKEELIRTLEYNMKMANKSQVDGKANRRAESREEPRDSRNISLSSPAKEAKSSTPQKASLSSFITKVDKGAALPVKAPATRKTEESSSSLAPGRPYLTLEDKSSSKPSREASETAKTTTNTENKTITYGKNKLNQQALAKSYGLTSPQRDTQDDEEIIPKRDAFTYYITSQQKYHRNWNESDYFSQIYKEHLIQSFQALTFCKYLKNVDPKVLAQKKVFLPKRPTHKDKKTIVFDLDETLIHCNESTDVPADVILPIKFPHGEVIEAGINIRPYAVEMLKEISQHFEVIVFTASHSCYANVVLDYLDPQQQYIHHRLFRESCVVSDEGVYIKDLRVFANRDLKDLVLVDNAAYSYGYQVENGVPCIPFYDNKDDQELKHLIPYLKSFLTAKDCREVNKQTFKLHAYTMYDSLDKVLNKVILQN